jgi:starch synthase
VPEHPPSSNRPPESSAESDRFGALPYWAFSTLLPLGIAAADMNITVSPSYAEEILTPEFGAGLEDYLRTQQDRLVGILNGLDTAAWDPAADPNLPQPFQAGSILGRAAAKAALQQRLNLEPDPEIPLIGIVSRLNEQKGIDLALPALECWCGRGNQAAILGAGDPWLEQQCRAFAARHRRRAAMETGYHDDLAALIYGGSDYLLIPSRYEPCGTTQMIAMRYGSLPIVRAVGGLKDTVRDLAGAEGNGLVFADSCAPAAALALGRAEELFHQKDRLAAAQLRGMTTDFGWERPVDQYLDVYKQALAR